MTLCEANGWTESNRPICGWCANPIGIRGDVPSNSVLVGEILLTILNEKVIRIAHFNCERHLWRMSAKTDKWWERIFLGERKFVLASSRMEWAEREPWIVGA